MPGREKREIAQTAVVRNIQGEVKPMLKPI